MSLDISDSSPQDGIEISENARLQYSYMTELENPTNPINKKSSTENNVDTNNTFLPNNSIDLEFIENYFLM